MLKLLYLDIDGVVLPRRAYLLPKQPMVVRLFDPCAVSILNEICKETGAKIAIHSTWIFSRFWQASHEGPNYDVHDHCIAQGILEEYFFHEDIYCPRDFWSERHERINAHRKKHNPDQIFVFDDEDLSASFGEDFYKCDFDIGITFDHYIQICGDKDAIKTGWQV